MATVAQVGQRYSKVGSPSFIWEVISIVVDHEGIRHCHIMAVSDRTNIKLISEITLTSRKFYRLASDAPSRT